jgi:general secretion pathway protein B
MSLILDALKKLDREKSSRRNGVANIAVEILRSDLPRSGKRILIYCTAIFFTAVIAAGITYAVMAQLGYLPKSSPPAPVNPPAPSQQVAVAPLPTEPVRDTREGAGQAPLKMENQAESKKPADSVNEKKTSRDVFAEEADTAPRNMKKSDRHVSKEPATTAPSLKLSGIIWHEEPKERRAMINGTIATEGSVIEGVKVVEIHPNKVRFSYNGQPYEISMGK